MIVVHDAQWPVCLWSGWRQSLLSSAPPAAAQAADAPPSHSSVVCADRAPRKCKTKVRGGSRMCSPCFWSCVRPCALWPAARRTALVPRLHCAQPLATVHLPAAVAGLPRGVSTSKQRAGLAFSIFSHAAWPLSGTASRRTRGPAHPIDAQPGQACTCSTTPLHACSAMVRRSADRLPTPSSVQVLHLP